MKECIDITEQYLSNASPNDRELIRKRGYIESLHISKIQIAESRLRRGFASSLDIIMLSDNKLRAVYRYQK